MSNDRREADSDGTDREMRRFAKQYPHLMIYILAGLVTLLGTIGWSYLKWNSDRISVVEAKAEAEGKANEEQKAKLQVIDERQQRSSKDVEEIKGDVKDIQKDIKELLRQNTPRPPRP